MRRRAFLTASLAAAAAPAVSAAAAEPAAHVTEERLHGRRAFVLQNTKMRVAVLQGGGFIGEVRLTGADPASNINPMRVAHYQTIDPYTYDIRRDGARYGAGMQRRLMSGYMGHFTCFPHFAASSRAELEQDYGQHGELIAVKWERLRAARESLAMAAALPATNYLFERRITMQPDETVAYVTETAENMARYDRPYQWVQHTTFGPDFVQIGKTFADGAVANVVLGRGAEAKTTGWPSGPNANDAPRDYRVFSGQGSLWLLQQAAPRSYCTLYNENYGILIGYVFEAAKNPWLLDYQENMRVTETPWDGKVVMRGLCFGNSVTSGGLRNAVQQRSMLDVPSYDWIEARQRIDRTYAIFIAEVGLGFRGVASLTAAGGKIAIVERETGRRIEIAASGLA